MWLTNFLVFLCLWMLRDYCNTLVYSMYFILHPLLILPLFKNTDYLKWTSNWKLMNINILHRKWTKNWPLWVPNIKEVVKKNVNNQVTHLWMVSFAVFLLMNVKELLQHHSIFYYMFYFLSFIFRNNMLLTLQ